MVLDLLSGLLAFLFGGSTLTTKVQPANWSGAINEAIVESLATAEPLVTAEPDPAATAFMQQHINALAGQGFPQDGQGIWIRAGDQVLADHLGTVPLPAASLTKIPTTLVALATWGPKHQFATIASVKGTLQAGVLQGDLIIQGEGDPFFVWEEAIALGNALNQAGIRQVTGDLVIAGRFAMNFETEPVAAGTLLKQGFDEALWSDEVETQYQQLPVGTNRPQVNITGTVRLATPEDVQAAVPLVRHQSMPLANILKGMNVYSNNVIADDLAIALGGAATMAKTAAELANVPAEEIQLVNGSGLGEDNRISPRAVTAMLIAIQKYLQPRQMTIADVFPVLGTDGGTMKGRRIPQGAVLKTGTLNAVSSLAGVVPTRDRGLIWFTVINLGSGDLQIPHDQQDLLLQNLQQTWGLPTPLPPSILPSENWRKTYQLGAAERNQLL
ncbi:MAG: D-alanyl-D-alanine carboxypeptidase [Elainellaceae cyanobacterium]